MKKSLITAKTLVNHYPNKKDYDKLLLAELENIDRRLFAAVKNDQNSLIISYHGKSFRKLGQDIHKSLTERGFQITPPLDDTGKQIIYW